MSYAIGSSLIHKYTTALQGEETDMFKNINITVLPGNQYPHYASKMKVRDIYDALEEGDIVKGSVVGLYSGKGDWERATVDEYTYRLIPLVDALKKYECVPVLCGCRCYEKEKYAVANALGINILLFTHGEVPK